MCFKLKLIHQTDINEYTVLIEKIDFFLIILFKWMWLIVVKILNNFYVLFDYKLGIKVVYRKFCLYCFLVFLKSLMALVWI